MSNKDLEQYKVNVDLWKASVASANSYAAMAVKSLLILNGASALAFLALIGHIYGSANSASQNVPELLTTSLIYFGWGAFLGPVTAFLSYATEFHYAQANSVDDPPNHPQAKYAVVYHIFAILCASTSLFLFIRGMYSAVEVFSN